MKIFVAGATGAIGTRLVPILERAGHQVIGTTRKRVKADALRAADAEAVIMDAVAGELLNGRFRLVLSSAASVLHFFRPRLSRKSNFKTHPL